MLGIKESKAAKIARAVILALFFLWSLIPVYIVITNAIKPTLDITAIPPKLFLSANAFSFPEGLQQRRFPTVFQKLNHHHVCYNADLRAVWRNGCIWASDHEIQSRKTGLQLSFDR